MTRGLRAVAHDPVLRLVATALFALGAGICSFVPYQSLIATTIFGFSTTSYALVLTAGSLVAVSGAVAVGILTDRLSNRRSAAIASGALWLGGSALVTLLPVWPSFILAHAVLLPLGGTLFGQLFVLARIASDRHGPDLREPIQGTVRAAFALPFIAILPLWSAAIGAGLPLFSVYPATAASALVLLALILFGWPPDTGAFHRSPQASKPAEALRDMVGAGVLVRLIAVGMLKAGPTIYMILLGLVLTGAGRDAGDVALFAGLVAGGEIPVMLAVAALVTRVRRQTVLTGAALIHAGFLAGFPLAAGTTALWVFVIPAAVGAGVILSVAIGYLQDLLAHRPGAGGSLIAVHAFAGDAMAAAAFGVGTAIGGYHAAALTGAAVVATGGLLLWRLDRPGRRATA